MDEVDCRNLNSKMMDCSCVTTQSRMVVSKSYIPRIRYGPIDQPEKDGNIEGS